MSHSLTVVAEKNFGIGWNASGAFRYATGKPHTPVTGATFDQTRQLWVPSYGPPFSQRLTPLQRVDLSISRFMPLSPESFLVVFASVNNLFDRVNIFEYRYSKRLHGAHSRSKPVQSLVLCGGQHSHVRSAVTTTMSPDKPQLQGSKVINKTLSLVAASALVISQRCIRAGACAHRRRQMGRIPPLARSTPQRTLAIAAPSQRRGLSSTARSWHFPMMPCCFTTKVTSSIARHLSKRASATATRSSPCSTKHERFSSNRWR